MKNQLDDADLDWLATFIDSLAKFDAQDEAEGIPSRTLELYLRSFLATPLAEPSQEDSV